MASPITKSGRAAIPAATTAATAGAPPRRQQLLVLWLPLALGLAALYLPTFVSLFQGIWGSGEQGHGPIILAICAWLIYRKWPEMMQVSEHQQISRWGWPVAAIGLVLYVLGRSQDILIFEVGSLIWMLCALLLLTRGAAALKAQWFSLFFLLFMVPLPGQIVDLVTMPMKIAVSYVAENLLYTLGYPIARVGVILQIGQYKLLVADACAGLHTLLTLEALGLLYLNLVRRDSVFRNTGLALLIVPISFTANVIRVTTLVLITYHFGDAAGQGFLHGFAGMVLFMSALCLIIGLDTLLQTVEKFRRRTELHHPKPASP
ncbi:exosortase B [Xylophilus rhododendri]|uniref:Exosortase B n=1 Tax=Xylophilus rhododendri TaxID=2697032 RepID=A0A857J7H2_9BURK|nr:exosortase B [Xylophilus rhododendri]QHI99980.1 exosortase B [Xylophilus rhododendri]